MPLRAAIKKGEGIENCSSPTVLRHLNQENQAASEYKLFSLQRVNGCFANAHICSRALRGGGRVLARSKPAAAANYATAKLLLALCLGRLTWAPYGPCPTSVRVYKRRLIEAKVGSRFLSSKEINPAEYISPRF